MKLWITMKDPDALADAVGDEQHRLKQKLMKELKISEEAAIVEAEYRAKELQSVLNEYFEWGEYVTIEVDSETKTVRVVKKNEEKL